jgi:hypothetical protein
MWDKLGRIGAATVVGVGLVVGVNHPMNAPLMYAAAPQLAAHTVMAMGGLGYEDVDPDQIKTVVGGRFADADTVIGLPWPGELAPFNGTLTLNQSVAVGLENMSAAIKATPGKKVVLGASGSTLVVDEMMRLLANAPSAPPADELSFVVLGDANRGAFKTLAGFKLPIFDYTVPALPVTPYDILVVTGEYDGMGDWPDRSWNLLADLNALAGASLLQQLLPEDIVDTYKLDAFGSVHYDAMFADLTEVPEENVTVEVNRLGGVTTTCIVPTNDLPLLRPLKPLGVPQETIDTLESVLRPIIDSAYIRNDPKAPAKSSLTRAPASTGPTITAAAAVQKSVPTASAAVKVSGKAPITRPTAGS